MISEKQLEGIDYVFQPLSRRLGKKYYAGMKNMKVNKSAETAEGLMEIIEECIIYSLVHIGGLDQMMKKEDYLLDLSEPTYDRLLVHFQKYYSSYKKKLKTST